MAPSSSGMSASNDMGSGARGLMDLWEAAGYGDVHALEKWVEAGGKLDARRWQDGFTPLMVAAHTNQVEAIEWLVDHGADVKTVHETNGSTALWWAASAGHNAAVEALVRGALALHADGVPETCSTGLIAAAMSGHAVTARLLMSLRANPNSIECRGGHTALHLAAWAGHVDVVNTLLPHTDAWTCNYQGETALDLARGARKYECIDALERAQARKDIWTLAASDHTLELQSLLHEKGHAMAAAATRGHKSTPLHSAARNGRTLHARILLAHGANADAQDVWGCTALMYAVAGRHTDFAKVLLEAGADASMVNKDGKTAGDLVRSHAASEEEAAELLATLQVESDSTPLPPLPPVPTQHESITIAPHAQVPGEVKDVDRFDSTEGHGTTEQPSVAEDGDAVQEGVELPVQEEHDQPVGEGSPAEASEEVAGVAVDEDGACTINEDVATTGPTTNTRSTEKNRRRREKKKETKAKAAENRGKADERTAREEEEMLSKALEEVKAAQAEKPSDGDDVEGTEQEDVGVSKGEGGGGGGKKKRRTVEQLRREKEEEQRRKAAEEEQAVDTSSFSAEEVLLHLKLSAQAEAKKRAQLEADMRAQAVSSTTTTQGGGKGGNKKKEKKKEKKQQQHTRHEDTHSNTHSDRHPDTRATKGLTPRDKVFLLACNLDLDEIACTISEGKKLTLEQARCLLRATVTRQKDVIYTWGFADAVKTVKEYLEEAEKEKEETEHFDDIERRLKDFALDRAQRHGILLRLLHQGHDEAGGREGRGDVGQQWMFVEAMRDLDAIGRDMGCPRLAIAALRADMRVLSDFVDRAMQHDWEGKYNARQRALLHAISCLQCAHDDYGRRMQELRASIDHRRLALAAIKQEVHAERVERFRTDTYDHYDGEVLLTANEISPQALGKLSEDRNTVNALRGLKVLVSVVKHSRALEGRLFELQRLIFEEWLDAHQRDEAKEGDDDEQKQMEAERHTHTDAERHTDPSHDPTHPHAHHSCTDLTHGHTHAHAHTHADSDRARPHLRAPVYECLHESDSEESRSTGDGDGDDDEDSSLDTTDSGGAGELEGENWGCWENRRAMLIHLLRACDAYDLTHALRSLCLLLEHLDGHNSNDEEGDDIVASIDDHVIVSLSTAIDTRPHILRTLDPDAQRAARWLVSDVRLLSGREQSRLWRRYGRQVLCDLCHLYGLHRCRRVLEEVAWDAEACVELRWALDRDPTMESLYARECGDTKFKGLTRLCVETMRIGVERQVDSREEEEQPRQQEEGYTHVHHTHVLEEGKEEEKADMHVHRETHEETVDAVTGTHMHTHSVEEDGRCTDGGGESARSLIMDRGSGGGAGAGEGVIVLEGMRGDTVMCPERDDAEFVLGDDGGVGRLERYMLEAMRKWEEKREGDIMGPYGDDAHLSAGDGGDEETEQSILEVMRLFGEEREMSIFSAEDNYVHHLEGDGGGQRMERACVTSGDSISSVPGSQYGRGEEHHAARVEQRWLAEAEGEGVYGDGGDGGGLLNVWGAVSGGPVRVVRCNDDEDERQEEEEGYVARGVEECTEHKEAAEGVVGSHGDGNVLRFWSGPYNQEVEMHGCERRDEVGGGTGAGGAGVSRLMEEEIEAGLGGADKQVVGDWTDAVGGQNALTGRKSDGLPHTHRDSQEEELESCLNVCGDGEDVEWVLRADNVPVGDDGGVLRGRMEPGCGAAALALRYFERFAFSRYNLREDDHDESERNSGDEKWAEQEEGGSDGDATERLYVGPVQLLQTSARSLLTQAWKGSSDDGLDDEDMGGFLTPPSQSTPPQQSSPAPPPYSPCPYVTTSDVHISEENDIGTTQSSSQYPRAVAPPSALYTHTRVRTPVEDQHSWPLPQPQRPQHVVSSTHTHAYTDTHAHAHHMSPVRFRPSPTHAHTHGCAAMDDWGGDEECNDGTQCVDSIDVYTAVSGRVKPVPAPAAANDELCGEANMVG